MIKIKNADKKFGNQWIFKQLSLEITQPGIYFVQGKSGSGKSTLLNILAGFDKFDTVEQMQVDPNNICIFQNYELIDELNVQDNIYLSRNKDQKTEALVRKLGLTDLLDHYPSELSGGQKQRVGIARALIVNPNLIFCDEPTESLDIENKLIVMNILKELSAHKIVLIVSHDQNIIQEYADEIYELSDYQLQKRLSNPLHNEIIYDSIETKKNIKKILNKIILKKTLFSSLGITFFLLIILGLLIFQKNMFYIPHTDHTVNASMLYIEDYGSDDHSFLDECQKILKFDYARINNKEVKSDIFPYVENTLPIKGTSPKENEVIINQNLALEKNLTIGDTLHLVYTLSAIQSDMPMKISGIVEESDTQNFGIYYNYESVKEALSQIQFFDGRSYWNYIENYGNLYQRKYSYSTIEGQYETFSESNNLHIFNPLVEYRNNLSEKSRGYQLIFRIVDVILISGLLLFIILYLKKDTTKYLRTCSIIKVSLQTSIIEMKKTYRFIKILTLLILETIGVSILLSLLFINHNHIFDYFDVLKIIGFATLIFIIYVFSVIFHSSKLKDDQISTILKTYHD